MYHVHSTCVTLRGIKYGLLSTSSSPTLLLSPICYNVLYNLCNCSIIRQEIKKKILLLTIIPNRSLAVLLTSRWFHAFPSSFPPSLPPPLPSRFPASPLSSPDFLAFTQNQPASQPPVRWRRVEENIISRTRKSGNILRELKYFSRNTAPLKCRVALCNQDVCQFLKCLRSPSL